MHKIKKASTFQYDKMDSSTLDSLEVTILCVIRKTEERIYNTYEEGTNNYPTFTKLIFYDASEILCY